MFLLLLNLKEQQKSGRLSFTISSSSRVIYIYNSLKIIRFRIKSGKKLCRNQSKSIKFVTSCTGHVDGMKK